jgi:hypothetical protein
MRHGLTRLGHRSSLQIVPRMPAAAARCGMGPSTSVGPGNLSANLWRSPSGERSRVDPSDQP